jgi:hypothetical protein
MAKKPYEKGSIADLAVRGFSEIQKLSKSSLVSEKLSAINMLLFLFILGICISFYLSNYSSDMIVFIIIFVLSLILSSISLLLYSPVLGVVVSLSQNKIEGLRISIIILFIDLTLAFAGLLFKSDFLIKVSLGIIGLQFILIVLASFITLPKGSIQDKKIEPSQIWGALGRISIISGILSFIIDIILILIKI